MDELIWNKMVLLLTWLVELELTVDAPTLTEDMVATSKVISLGIMSAIYPLLGIELVLEAVTVRTVKVYVVVAVDAIELKVITPVYNFILLA